MTPERKFGGLEAGLRVRLAEAADMSAVHRLRYEVFAREMGAAGPAVDHARGEERDRFDDFADHLILVDESRRRGDHVAGAYRLMDGDQARAAGQFYSEDEFDLAPLRARGGRLLELGRSCLRADLRGGPALHLLWQGLERHCEGQGIETLFGVASFPGTDVAAIAPSLGLLGQDFLAPPELRVQSRQGTALSALPPPEDRRAAVLAMPPLLKGYLRLGGTVGDGYFVDRDFGTIDVCLILRRDRR